MTAHVAVLGAGYAGATVVQTLQEAIDERAVDAQLTWVSDHDYHFLLHEVHRVVRRPDLADALTVPVDAIAAADTRFEQRTVEDVHGPEREVAFADGERLAFDYVVDCLGSETAFHGIDGMREHALPLKSLDDARAIREATTDAAANGSSAEPATVVVGGAGLSGIQCAGELAALRDEAALPLDVRLLEAEAEIFPGHDDDFQDALRERLADCDVDVSTGAQIEGVDGDALRLDDAGSVEYDVLVWTGGVTGRDELDDPAVEEERGRVEVDDTLRSDDERVFAVGDAALVDLDDPPPPTAQVAWRAGEVAARNVANAIAGDDLEHWTYEDWGTFVSIGDDVVAHGVKYTPVETFGGPVARQLKHAVATRWLEKITTVDRAIDLWFAL